MFKTTGFPVKSASQLIGVFVLFILFISVATEGYAQRGVDYRELVVKQQRQQQSMFFDFIVLPGDRDSTVTFASVFSLSYNYLPFKKNRQSSSDKSFYSSAELSLEVFESEGGNNSSLQNMSPVARSFWSDTVFAESFEQSQSKEEFLKGNIAVTLEPGTYSYIVQMKRGDQPESQMSRRQNRNIELYSEMAKGPILYGERVKQGENPTELKLSKMGSNVEFGKDFTALAFIPDYDDQATYSVQIRQLQVSNEDTSTAGEVFSEELSAENFHTGLTPRLVNRNGENIVRLTSSEEGFAYALMDIPNRRFPNAAYRVTIRNNSNDQIAAQGMYRSNWLNIPASLLNLDVAIDMLRFIIDEETQRSISRGSHAEREKKFREFWKQRDPTPETAYNELMAEYYRRIDYAYKNFTTENTIGYESDRGEIYIKYGAPENIERKFPTNGATVEIWQYSNRRFVFRATTGFGDFKLVTE